MKDRLMTIEIVTDKEFELLIRMLTHDLEKLITITSRVLKRLVEGSLTLENPRHRSLVQSSFYSMERSKKMIADLNDTIANRKLNVSIKPCNIAELIDKVADSFAPIAHNENISFEKNIENPEIVIDSDPDLLTRIIENYLYNAISHTETRGYIKLSLKSENKSEKNSCVICVENSGSTIPEDDLNKIFNVGVQLNLRQKRYWRGSGLGLAFCKMAAEAIGAEVGAVNLSEETGVIFYCSFASIKNNL
ncbi:MAG: HAMP domain-containing histidine kinase [Desulfamplus sp.]|nr:HAMP domain-containing histidine kinase [Desulfamplus sp.]